MVQHRLPINNSINIPHQAHFIESGVYLKFRVASSFLHSFTLRETFHCNSVNYILKSFHLPLSETKTFSLQPLGYISYLFHSL